MKITVSLSGKTLHTFMRGAGYAPAFVKAASAKPGESVFHRFLSPRQYPKFHIYATLAEDKKSARLNLHLDQKQPSYAGTHAHAAEHEGPIVEAEAARIQAL